MKLRSVLSRSKVIKIKKFPTVSIGHTNQTRSMSTIENVSFPPTQAELEKLQGSDALPEKFRRDIHSRIFVNRSVNLDNIQYFGYDMDYTLADYKSPAFEELSYGLSQGKLIKKGYPKEIGDLKYDPAFPVRGTFLDKKYGNLLQLDNFGFILRCVHGKKVIQRDTDEVKVFYPDNTISPNDIGSRYYCFDTLFGLSEACLYAQLVDFFEKNLKIEFTDLKDNTSSFNYWSLFDDLREATHESHMDGSIKDTILKDISKYIKRNDKLALLFHRMRQQGRKVFLMTNSEFNYTNAVMSYLLDNIRDDYPSWRTYFDIIITNAMKPRFFLEGSSLREVDLEKGTLSLIQPTKFERGKIYAGGNFRLFKALTGTQGGEVLYVGDNIYHDIIQTKRSRCLWRTLLIVREVDDEVKKWGDNGEVWKKLGSLEYLRAKTYQGQDINNDRLSGDETIKKHITETTGRLDDNFNKYFGSLFRSGTSESYFSNQVRRFADLYSSDHLNLLNYPLYYYFSSLPMLLPHEREAVHAIQRGNSDEPFSPLPKANK
ncbi:5'-nucleotidase [Acrasis kona]|uniref:5'-nucleotidase n=1 Tax=Acrasis kona TaxID=1008807 RepID=A0AAW2YV42_9EUKA